MGGTSDGVKKVRSKKLPVDGTGDGLKKSKNSGWWHKFKQQENSSWSPKYTPTGVSPLLIGFGVLLVPLGVAVLVISSDRSSQLKEMAIDYTNCPSTNYARTQCADFIKTLNWTGESPEVCQCDVEFELNKPIKGKELYMYYTLENFHQNVRQYASSRDNDQLLGKIGTAENPVAPKKDCDPLDTDSDGNFYFPCGSIANSMFNDSIQLYYNHSREGLVKIEQQRRGIAWPTDIKHRYKNPEEFNDRNHSIWRKFKKPRDWSRTIWDLDPENPENNGVQNEDFIVWMRIATFSNFQKLYRIIRPAAQESVLGDGLPAGKYRLKINYTFEVTSFKGRKGILLSSTTIFGQKNYFQGIAAVSVGGICLVLGLMFLLCGCCKRVGKGAFGRSANSDL